MIQNYCTILIHSKYGADVLNNILFLDAFSGCDTTKFILTLEKHEHLNKVVELSNEKTIDPNKIVTIVIFYS